MQSREQPDFDRSSKVLPSRFATDKFSIWVPSGCSACFSTGLDHRERGVITTQPPSLCFGDIKC